MTVTKPITVVSYNPNWPQMFEAEAESIRKALGDNCIGVHHIGSTSVPNLAAKPKIDIVAEVKAPEESISALENAGFTYRGEWNIPFKYGFTKRGDVEVNLYVFEENHPEIELNLAFRDYLRSNPKMINEYAALKENLLQNESSFEKNNSMFTGYNLGKDAFIRKVLKLCEFNRIRFLRCTHYAEWEKAKHFRQTYFFDKVPINDPYEWTFNHKDHVHFVLYQGVEIIGYSHIQLWPNQRTALRIIVIDEPLRNYGFGSQFLSLIERRLKQQGHKSLHAESSPKALAFYQKHSYIDIPFDDPDGYESSPKDIPLGKFL